MNKKIQTKPFNIYAPIERVDEEQRTVQAYAFVNEVVEGEGGLRLKRSSMEAATPDYMAWANVREMHQPKAAGVARSVTWDEKGARMTLEVVDDDAWEKVKRGVYKGLSVGVVATVMRGKDVDACRWIETSLVDRPKDPDARIVAVRADDLPETFEAEVARASFAEYMEDCEESAMRNAALDWLWNSLWDIQHLEDGTDKAALVAQTCDEFRDYMIGVVQNSAMREQSESERSWKVGEMVVRVDGIPEVIARLESAEKSISALTIERDGAKTELARVSGLLSQAEERVKTLEQMPVPQPAVRFPAAFARDLARGFNPYADAEEEQAKALRAEYDEIISNPPTDEGQKKATVVRMQTIKAELARLGCPIQ